MCSSIRKVPPRPLPFNLEILSFFCWDQDWSSSLTIELVCGALPLLVLGLATAFIYHAASHTRLLLLLVSQKGPTSPPLITSSFHELSQRFVPELRAGISFGGSQSGVLLSNPPPELKPSSGVVLPTEVSRHSQRSSLAVSAESTGNTASYLQWYRAFSLQHKFVDRGRCMFTLHM